MFSFSLLIIISVFVLFVIGTEIRVIDANYQDFNLVYVESPTFSVKSGFYTDPFFLEIIVPEGTKVFYTLDCSEPTLESSEYVCPLYLDNASGHDNMYSMNRDVSTCFYSDLVSTYSTRVGDYNYSVPDYLIDKCNVVRAIAVDKEGNKSEIVSSSYFIGLDESYSSVSTVSIITNPSNLFDYYKGIYVTGYRFDEYQKYNTQLGNVWGFWDANYIQRGIEWEREASLFVFEKGERIISQNVGIRIQGNISRAYACKSLNIFAREKYSGVGLLEFSPFENGYLSSKLTLSNGGNRRLTKINDVMMADCCSSLDISTMSFEPCVLFLDGEYWGFFWMAESYSPEYFNYHYGVDEDNVLMIKNGDIEIGKEVFEKLYNDMKHEITTIDLSSDSNYRYACSLIDIDSFIDYYALNCYISRSEDWPGSNFALWRTLKTDDTEFGDCKWRWMLFDSNSRSMSPSVLNDNSLEFIIENDALFASFWKNESFRSSFVRRLFEISDECFDPERINIFIDEYDSKWRDYLAETWKRFHGSNNELEPVYLSELEELKAFFSQRRAVIESWFI